MNKNKQNIPALTLIPRLIHNAARSPQRPARRRTPSRLRRSTPQERKASASRPISAIRHARHRAVGQAK